MDMVLEGERQLNNELALLCCCLRRDSAVVRSLKNLTIAVQISGIGTWDDAVASLSKNSAAWDDLDTILCNSESVLSSVRIFVDPPKYMIVEQQLQISMRCRLPRLYEHGILSIETGAVDDLLELAWSGNRS
jgi:hypothetical protein